MEPGSGPASVLCPDAYSAPGQPVDPHLLGSSPSLLFPSCSSDASAPPSRLLCVPSCVHRPRGAHSGLPLGRRLEGPRRVLPGSSSSSPPDQRPLLPVARSLLPSPLSPPAPTLPGEPSPLQRPEDGRCHAEPRLLTQSWPPSWCQTPSPAPRLGSSSGSFLH